MVPNSHPAASIYPSLTHSSPKTSRISSGWAFLEKNKKERKRNLSQGKTSGGSRSVGGDTKDLLKGKKKKKVTSSQKRETGKRICIDHQLHRLQPSLTL